MQQEITQAKNTQVARPLHVLVPLIKKDLDEARTAADRACKPYYQAAGEKLIEAKAQMSRGEFTAWAARAFKISERQAQLYMSYARATANIQNRAQAPSLHQHRKNQGQRQTVYPQAWHGPIKETLNGVDTGTLNRQKAELNRAEEREAQRKLALQLIDIGFKALATKLHPDKKGGSREAMTRLNQVRDRLKLHA